MNSLLVVETEMRKDTLKGYLKEILRSVKPQKTYYIDMVMERLKKKEGLYLGYNRTIVTQLLGELEEENVIAVNEAKGYYWNHQSGRCHRTNGDSECLCCGTELTQVGEVRVCSNCPQMW